MYGGLPWDYDLWRLACPPEYNGEPEEEEEEEKEDWTVLFAAELRYALNVFPWQSIDNVYCVSEKQVEFVDGDICYIPVGLVR